MPATTPTTLPFVSTLPIATSDFATTLNPHIGQKYPRAKFAPPSDTAKANIKAFVQTLNAYDSTPTLSIADKLTALMKQLNLSAVRLKESPNDSVIFYPNDVQGKAPIVCGGVLTWRFGPTAQFNVVGGIPQVFVYDPHSGQDGTLYTVTQQFLSGAKGLLSHAFNPNVADNPNFKGNPITASNIKRFADPAHSNTTAFVPFITAINELFPHSGCTVSHGMAGKPNFQMIANNDRTASFLEGGTRDWCAMLTIALALQDLPLNPNIAVIESSMPGYIVKNGVKAPILSINDRNSPLRENPAVTDNTDSVGHLGNGATDPFSMGKHLDNSFFVEFGPNFRGQNSKIMPLFTAAQAMAAAWYMAYDPAVQDPWQLAKRFPDVYNDMSLYPKLFDPAFVKAYKQNGTNPYANSSSAAAVADMLASYSEAGNTEVSIVNVRDPEVDVSADLQPAPVAATTPLTFSSAGKQAASAKAVSAPVAAAADDQQNSSRAKMRAH